VKKDRLLDPGITVPVLVSLDRTEYQVDGFMSVSLTLLEPSRSWSQSRIRGCSRRVAPSGSVVDDILL